MTTFANRVYLVVLLAAGGFFSAVAAEPPPELARWLGPQVWQRDFDGPIVSLGKPGEFDDTHIFAPTVALEDGRYVMWYCGSRDTRYKRVFRLGLATSANGKQFEKLAENPVFQLSDGVYSVLTPALLRSGDGTVVREDGKLRMWFSSTAFGKTGLHTLHETRSADGIHWTEPSAALLPNVYCPTVLKTADGYEMWYSDVSKRPWVICHAMSADGTAWKVSEPVVLQLSQPWEAEIVVYPTVLKIDGVYLMWYGSYYSAVRRQTTAIGFAASVDGVRWYKHSQNPVLRPDPDRPWESNYVGSGCVMRLSDGSFRYWYASRKAPPFVNLYFAINTARWSPELREARRLPLPPAKGDVGILLSSQAAPSGRHAVDVLEVIDADDVIVRAWYSTPGGSRDEPAAADPTFVDLWIHGIETKGLVVGSPGRLTQVFRVTGNQSFDTTCGSRSLPLLEPMDSESDHELAR